MSRITSDVRYQERWNRFRSLVEAGNCDNIGGIVEGADLAELTADRFEPIESDIMIEVEPPKFEKPTYLPTPEEIAAECALIRCERAEREDAERRERAAKEGKILPPRKQISIFVPFHEWKALRDTAGARGMAMTELCRLWLSPHFEELTGEGVTA